MQTSLPTRGFGIRLRFVMPAETPCQVGSELPSSENKLSMMMNAPEAKLIMDSQVNNEVIILLSNEVQYFGELETAAKIRKYIKQKNVSQLSESIQDIIRKRQAQARILEESAKVQIDKAILDGEFFIYGEKVEIKYGDAKIKLDEALKQLIESVYFKLNLVNTFSESDADILTILNGEPQQGGFVGMGSNNEFALNEVSQWLEERHMSPSSFPLVVGSFIMIHDDFLYKSSSISLLLALNNRNAQSYPLFYTKLTTTKSVSGSFWLVLSG